jgi:hypothetical protein
MVMEPDGENDQYRNELNAHVEELKRAVGNENPRCRELGEELEEIRDKAQQEVEDMRAVVKEKSDQVLELGEQLDLVKKDQLAMAEHHSAKETYLEKENLELLVENRQLKKRLEGHATVSNGSSYSSTAVLNDDVAAVEASAKAASALVAPSVNVNLAYLHHPVSWQRISTLPSTTFLSTSGTWGANLPLSSQLQEHGEPPPRAASPWRPWPLPLID